MPSPITPPPIPQIRLNTPLLLLLLLTLLTNSYFHLPSPSPSPSSSRSRSIFLSANPVTIMEWRVFWPAESPIQLGAPFQKVYSDFQSGAVKKAGRTDIYLSSPPFIGIKLRGASQIMQNHESLHWEVKLRGKAASSNGLNGFETWAKDVHKWTAIAGRYEAHFGKSSADWKAVRRSMERNVQVAVWKRRVSFGSKVASVAQEVTELEVKEVKVGGRSLDLDALGVRRRWFTICIETRKTGEKQVEKIERLAREIVTKVNAEKVEFVLGGYPTWIHSFNFAA